MRHQGQGFFVLVGLGLFIFSGLLTTGLAQQATSALTFMPAPQAQNGERKTDLFFFPGNNLGWVNPDGTPHHIPQPHRTTGRIINVVAAYGANPADDRQDDRPALEQALRAAVPGDEIFLPEGTYNLMTPWSTDPTTNLRLYSEVNIRGASESGVVLKSTLDYRGAYTGKGNFIIRGLGITGVTITNLTLTATWRRHFSTDTRINNPEAGGPTVALGVYAGSAGQNGFTTGVTLEHLTVKRFRRMGITVGNGCHDVVVRNCTALEATDLGGGGAGYGFVLQGKEHQSAAANPFLGTVQDNWGNLIYGCRTVGPYIRHAIIIQYWAHHNLITGCNFNGTQLDAIDLHGEDEYSNEITHNNISGVVNGAGIGIGNSGGGGHDRSGPDNWIHDNLISASKKGISCEFGSDRELIEANIIRDNQGLAGGFGIGLGKTDGTIVRQNRILNNRAPVFNAIYLYYNARENESAAGGPTNCIVNANQLLDNTNNRIVLDKRLAPADWRTNRLE